MLHYKPYYAWRLGRNVHTVVEARYLNLYLSEEPDDPIPPPPDDPVPPPPDDDPVPPAPEPDPVPEPDDDPVPPPPDDPDPPDPDELRFPGVLVLGRSTESTLSDRGLYWFKVTDDKMSSWDIESVEHLRLTLLEKVTPWRACVAFDLPLESPFYETAKTFVLTYGGLVFE